MRKTSVITVLSAAALQFGYAQQQDRGNHPGICYGFLLCHLAP